MPKGCLCLGENPIIEESILRLLAVGIKQIVIVTGHLAEQFEPLRDRYQGAVQLVHNSYYADSGSMYSLYCARQHIDEDFLLLESDLIYERRALAALLEYPEDDILLLSGFTNSSDEVFVETNGGCLVAMSKNRNSLGLRIAGEFVGISRISQRLYRVMLQEAAKQFCTTRHMDYETDCLAAAAQVVPVNCHVVEDLVWAEIDDERQLIRARDRVYPAILQRENQAALLSEGTKNAFPRERRTLNERLRSRTLGRRLRTRHESFRFSEAVASTEHASLCQGRCQPDHVGGAFLRSWGHLLRNTGHLSGSDDRDALGRFVRLVRRIRCPSNARSNRRIPSLRRPT